MTSKPNPYTARPSNVELRTHHQNRAAALQLDNLLKALRDVCPLCKGNKKVGKARKTCPCVFTAKMEKPLSRLAGYGDITWTPLAATITPDNRKNLIIRLEDITCQKDANGAVLDGDGLHQESRDVIYTHLKCAIRLLGDPNFTWVDSTLNTGMSGLLSRKNDDRARILQHSDLLVMFAESALHYSAIARHIGTLLSGRTFTLSDPKEGDKGDSMIVQEVAPLCSWLVIPDGEDFNSWVNRASLACAEEGEAERFRKFCLNECSVVTLSAAATKQALGSARILNKERTTPRRMKAEKTLPLVAEVPWT